MKITGTRLRATVAAAVAIGATLVVGTTHSAVTASSNASVQLVDLGLIDPTTASFADGARFGTVESGGSTHHVDLDTGVTTPLEPNYYYSYGSVPRAFDGTYAYTAYYDGIQRQTIATGEIEFISIPYQSNTEIRDISDATPDGRFLLLDTNGYSYSTYRYENRHVLYDNLLQSYVTSLSAGLDPGGRLTVDARVSDDGDVIRYRVQNSDYSFDEAELTRSSGFRQSIALPPQSFTATWSASSDLDWLVFRSSDEILGIGISPTERLYRLNRSTGEATRVNIDAAVHNIRWFTALDDGRVIALVRRFIDNIESVQLYVWSNSDDAAHLITQSASGDPADGFIDTDFANIATDETGERIAFISSATNLAPGADSGDLHAYVATLDAVNPADPNPTPPALIRATLVSAEIPTDGGPSVLVGPTADAPLGPIGANAPTNPETAIATGPGGDQFHFDLSTRELVESDIPAMLTDTDLIFGASGDSVYLQTVSTGEITKITPEFPVVGNLFDPQPWTIISLDDIDASRRYLLFTADAGAIRRAFLYDMVAQAHVPWAPDGLGIGSFSEFSSSPTSGLRLSNDGSSVLVERSWRSPDILKWDIATGTRTTHSWYAFGERPYTVTDDLVWETFWSSTDPSNIGDNTRRPYRRNTRTGAIDAIPLNGLRGNEASVHEDGRVILVAQPIGNGTSPSRLFFWDGDTNDATEIIAGTTGPGSAEQIVSYHYDEDTEIVTFLTTPSSISVVENLASLYQADLTDPNAPTCMDLIVTVNIADGELPTSGNDVILGTDGRDLISGGGGDDVICAGDGNDVVDAGPGADTVYGENGFDTLFGADDDDRLYGGPDSDVLFGEAGNDIVFGSEGGDIIIGGSDYDVLVGGLGNDAVFGQLGTSLIFGGYGNDYLSGAPGDDAIYGQQGNDSIFGVSGNDNLFGQLGDDTINGGPGNDTCEGGPGTDVVNACEAGNP